jgi:hypothetical protein
LFSSGCLATGEIEIPTNYTGIPERAFYGCASVTKIDLKDKGGAIGLGAFYYCTNLTTIISTGSTTA